MSPAPDLSNVSSKPTLPATASLTRPFRAGEGNSETDYVTSPGFQLRRPFNWGLLLLADQASTELPEGPRSRPPYVTATQSAAAIAVRHAQDVDDLHAGPAEVTVNLYVDTAPERDPAYLGSIDIPSGVIEVGDAEETEALEIGAGHWTLQISAEPTEHPEKISIWLNRQT